MACAMAKTCEDLIEELRGIEADVAVYEHPEVLTIEAWNAAFRGEDAPPGILAKNLLLKDKNNKLYLIVALDSTKIDIKVLSVRLGLGKKQPRMASPQVLDRVLQVPKGCLSPLALCRPQARDVVCLIDAKLASADEKILFHPLRNDRSVGLSFSGLQAYLASIGHTNAHVVEFVAEYKAGEDNPPDLKPFVDVAGDFAAMALDDAPDAQQAKPAPKKKAAKAGGSGGGGQGGKALAGDDVHAMVAEIALLGAIELSADQAKDLELILNAFKNVAYTRGYVAARSEIKARIGM